MQFDLVKRKLYILATSMSGFGGSQWEKVAMLKLSVFFFCFCMRDKQTAPSFR